MGTGTKEKHREHHCRGGDYRGKTRQIESGKIGSVNMGNEVSALFKDSDSHAGHRNKFYGRPVKNEETEYEPQPGGRLEQIGHACTQEKKREDKIGHQNG